MSGVWQRPARNKTKKSGSQVCCWTFISAVYFFFFLLVKVQVHPLLPSLEPRMLAARLLDDVPSVRSAGESGGCGRRLRRREVRNP